MTLTTVDGKKKLQFAPVLTAHAGLGALSWPIHQRVYIPFHFIPPGATPSLSPYTVSDGPPTFDFTVERDSEFAQLLLEKAAEPLQNHYLRLCRIGIALHTYADTWAHEGFSGRSCDAENAVEIRRPTPL